MWKAKLFSRRCCGEYRDTTQRSKEILRISQLRQFCQGKNNTSRTESPYRLTVLEWAAATHAGLFGIHFYSAPSILTHVFHIWKDKITCVTVKTQPPRDCAYPS